MKLVRDEAESGALWRDLGDRRLLVSSALLVVEARRAAARYGALARGRTVDGLRSVTLLPLDPPTLDAAARLEPPHLRSLDALHLATALSLDEPIVYTYDTRLAEAAELHGLTVRAPA